MWNACKPILVGMASLVFGDFAPFLLSKMAKFPSWVMDYIVHGGQNIKSAQKFYAIRNFMRLEVDVKCMQTNLVSLASPFQGFCSFFKFGQISLSDHGPMNYIQSIGSKNGIGSKNSFK